MTLEEFKKWLDDYCELAQGAVKQFNKGGITPTETYWRTKEATLLDVRRQFERIK